MTGIGSDDAVVTALRLAARAPSVHNCQPWRWLVGAGTVHLYADGSRQVHRHAARLLDLLDRARATDIDTTGWVPATLMAVVTASAADTE